MKRGLAMGNSDDTLVSNPLAAPGLVLAVVVLTRRAAHRLMFAEEDGRGGGEMERWVLVPSRSTVVYLGLAVWGLCGYWLSLYVSQTVIDYVCVCVCLYVCECVCVST